MTFWSDDQYGLVVSRSELAEMLGSGYDRVVLSIDDYTWEEYVGDEV